MEDVMRNPAIDGWKDGLPYHKPEYVRFIRSKVVS